MTASAAPAEACGAFARMFPSLHIVGVEPSPVAIAEARGVVLRPGGVLFTGAAALPGADLVGAVSRWP